MAGMKKGLGRGLDALLEPYAGPEADRDAANRVLEISVRDIDTNRAQPRKSFDEAALRELADSIRVHGVVQPLLVRPNGSRYTIVAGERRFRAARLAGLETVPVLAAEYDEAQMQEVALIENLQREDLNPVEEAAAIRFLMQQHDLTQEEVSERLGKSRPAIANALRLLNLDRNVLELVRTGALSAGHGRALAAVTDAATQERLADECVRLGYSVRALESRVRNLQAGKKPSKKAAPAPHSGDLAQAERALRDRLGTRVRIAGDERRGRITIEYYSADDLQRIYERIVDE
jgi:ParB family chromosome partitioning protein